jgi:hypothetical protein
MKLMQLFFGLLFVLVLAIFAGCVHRSKLSCALDDIRSKIIKKMSKEHNLRVFGVGASAPKLVRTIDLDFVYKDPVEIVQARGMTIMCALEMLDCINQDFKLRPHLENYPFTSNNIMFSIIFNDVSDHGFNHNHHLHVTVMEGEVYYAKYLVEEGRFIDKFEETFEEALEKVLHNKLFP